MAVWNYFCTSEFFGRDFPKIQILTVEDLLAGKTVQLPPNLQTFKQAEKISTDSTDQRTLGFELPREDSL